MGVFQSGLCIWVGVFSFFGGGVSKIDIYMCGLVLMLDDHVCGS